MSITITLQELFMKRSQVKPHMLQTWASACILFLNLHASIYIHQKLTSNLFCEGASKSTSRVSKNARDDVDYLIWTRQNKLHFNPKLPTKVLIHGYQDNGETGWIISIKDSYLIKGSVQMHLRLCK